MQKLVRVGTRESALAMAQTKWIVNRLSSLWPDYSFEIVPMKTKGDKILDVALAKIGDKGLFTKELETALLEEEIDLAVHSMKDLPTKLPAGLIISAMTERHDPRDVLISPLGYTLKTLPQGSKVGTSSLRRRAQLLHRRPDLEIVDLRGNVNTRLAKMKSEGLGAIVLAAAGLLRLGLEDYITDWLDPETIIPAVGQGSIGVESRAYDERISMLLTKIDHYPTRAAITAERTLLAALEGGCQIPIGAHGLVNDKELVLTAMVASIDGKELVRHSLAGSADQPEALGLALTRELQVKGAQEILTHVLQEIER